MRVLSARPLVLPELDARKSVRRSPQIEFSDERLSRLTRREREVHRGIDAGLTVREIAFLFGRSETTIRRHRRNAIEKLASR